MGSDCCGPPAPETKVPMWKYIGLLALMCGGGMQVILPLMDNLSTLWADLPPLFGERGYIELTPASPELGQILIGGQPWLVLCNRPKVSKPPMWLPAAEFLATGETPDAFAMGVLDCTQRLPSGKTTYERFKLTPPAYSAPHALLCVNGRTPRMVTENMNADSDSQVKNFVNGIISQTKVSWPSVRSPEDLQDKCLGLRACVLVLHKGKMVEYEQDRLLSLAKQHRTLRWARLDLERMALSIEASLPSEQDEHPRLLVFRREKGGEGVLMAKAYRGAFEVEGLSSFLEATVKQVSGKGGEAEGWVVLKTDPTTAKRTDYNTKLYADKGAKVDL